jgi:tetratricopeptide (TPR) repeat protein
MSPWLPRSLACLGLGLGLAGCTPAARHTGDEQQDPYFIAGKDRVSALDYKGAIEAFERALESNPRSVSAHYELAVLQEQHENDYAAAIHHYQKVLQLRPAGYPADNARLRLPVCRQELAKTDSLATVNPAALRELERLREENQQLRQRVDWLQGRVAGAQSGAPTQALARGVEPASGVRVQARAAPAVPAGTNASSATSGVRLTPLPAPGAARTHVVKPGETPMSICRTHQLKLSAFLAANPGLDPKRMKPGQVVNLPAR